MLDQSSMKAAVNELCGLDSNVKFAAIVSSDGLVMVATHPKRDAAETLAAITSELLAKGSLSVAELNLGRLHSQLVLGGQGGVIIRAINDEMVLVAEISKQANVGKVFAVMNRIAARLSDSF